ncbi:hypothetical protein [Enterococcus mundtii]|uniref:hypothetical protein n=1 Tax=Enterococcus mundtii TaxID=53346 RepID=UPI0035C6846E
MDEQLAKLNQKIARIKDINDPEYDRLVAERNKLRQQITAQNERQSTATSSTSIATEVKSDPEKIEQLTEKISRKQAQIDRLKDLSDPRYEQYEAEKAQLIQEREAERLKSDQGSKSTKRIDVSNQMKETAPIVQADLKQAKKMIHHELDDQFEKLSFFLININFSMIQQKMKKISMS